jgi:hypothetical protein
MMAVPMELQQRPQWVTWGYEERGGKKTKPPFNARTGDYAESNDPSTWSTFDQAQAALTAGQGRWKGVGFVVGDGDPYAGIDLDNCVDDWGEIAPWALAIVKRLNSYTEITPSGRGLRIWISGALPGRGRKKGMPNGGAVEIYDRGRYFTVSGLHLGDTPVTIESRDAELAALMDELFPQPAARAVENRPAGGGIDLNDVELLAKAKAAKNGDKFSSLWRGDTSGHPSHSEADLALCDHLRFWTGGDRGRMDRLFRQSGLMRDKWDERHGEKTFGEMTLDKALSDVGDVYTPTRNGREDLGEDEVITSFSSFSSYRREEPQWPSPLVDAAFHGLAGDVVRGILPYTEADPAALLIDFLASFGNVIGLKPHAIADGAIHRARLFVVIVGRTNEGKKGTGRARIRPLFRFADEHWALNRQGGGVASGEGMIHQVRDAAEKVKVVNGERVPEIVDAGEDDKRLLVVETEYSALLKTARREGNITSEIIRQAWESDDLQRMTRNNPLKARGAHISIIGHITPDELRRNLVDTETSNGFANRFAYFCSRRSKLLPEGGGEFDYSQLAARVSDAVKCAKEITHVKRDPQAKAIWAAVYSDLSSDLPGLFGDVVARRAPQVVRLSVTYALLAGSPWVRAEHMLAALAVWDYSAASAAYIFGDSVGDRVADTILNALRSAPQGLSRWEISDLFSRNLEKADVDRALALLLKA